MGNTVAYIRVLKNIQFGRKRISTAEFIRNAELDLVNDGIKFCDRKVHELRNDIEMLNKQEVTNETINQKVDLLEKLRWVESKKQLLESNLKIEKKMQVIYEAFDVVKKWKVVMTSLQTTMTTTTK